MILNDGRHATQVAVKVKVDNRPEVAEVFYTHVTDLAHSPSEALHAALAYFDDAVPVLLEGERVLGAILLRGGDDDNHQ